MARRQKPFWDRWFELVPGHAKISGFYKDPIDPARPRYELVRGLGLCGAGFLLIFFEIVLKRKDAVLVTLGVYLILAGAWPLGRLAEFGAGRFIWVIATIGTVLHFAESPTLEMFGYRPGEWVLWMKIALGSGVCAGLLAGVWKLTNLAIHPTLAQSDRPGLEDNPVGPG